MRSIRFLFLVLTALLALGIIAAGWASASSPTVLTLAGESFPVELNGPTDNPTNEITSELQNAAGTLKGLGTLEELTFSNGTLVSHKLLLLKVKKGETSCNTAGDAPGEELWTQDLGTAVHDINSTSGFALLLTVSEFTVECGAAKIKIKGNILGLITPVGGGEKATGFSGAIHCSATVGEPAETKFFNSAGTEEVALLLANFGTGFKKACLDIGPGSVALTANKMIELMN